MQNSNLSNDLFSKACDLFPGGVNSPVRAFKSVDSTPFFVQSAKGAKLTDTNNKSYIDYVLSWGPLLFGHAFEPVVKKIQEQAELGTSYGACSPLESELAELMKFFLPSMEKMRFVSSGTEATMSAIRLARGFTGRNKIIKFDGNYHGHADFLLAKSGSGLATFALPDAAGVPAKSTEDTIILPYNNLKAAEQIFNQISDQIAGLIIEPIAGNMGCIMPEPGYLKGLQNLCQKNNSLFILDEVMTGFRADIKSCQGLWDLKPDLTCLAKVIGGGLPVGCFGGRKDIMNHLAPLGPVYQAGTLSGNPLAMASGIAMLTELKNNPEVFEQIKNKTQKLVSGLENLIAKSDKYKNRFQTNICGSMFGFAFIKKDLENHKITNFELGKNLICTETYAKLFKHMLAEGIFIAPSAFESGFLSSAHTDEHVTQTLDAFERFLKN